MTSGNVQVSQDGPVAVLTLTRPKKLNAVDSAALTELHRALADADADPAIRVVVLTGSGERAFCAGADIHEMAQSTPASYRDGLGTLFVRIVERMRGMGKPVIAAVNGYAFGGGMVLALGADLLVAADTAEFGVQEINVGMIGGASLLVRLLGHHRAAELTMLGEAIPAAEAARLGLVNRVVPAADLMPEARRLAHALAEKPATALRLLKQALRIGAGMELGAGLAYERDLNMLCFALPERVAAMQRFLGGRPETTGGQS